LLWRKGVSLSGIYSQEKLQRITKEIREDLKALSEFQEKTLDELTKTESDKVFYTHQKTISEKIIIELDKDYKFAVEHFNEDQIECPLCGTHHDNSIVNRTSILTDKQQAENQLKEINALLGSCVTKFEKLKIQLEKTRSDIDAIHSKYILEDEAGPVNLNDIIEKIAGVAIQDNVQKSKAGKLEKLDGLAKDIKGLTDEQKQILTDEEREAIQNSFITVFASYIELLNAEDINTSMIKTPMDYAKIVKEGGAAEGTRGILAYYLTIFSLINTYSDEVIAPIVIDTPNQQEQSPENYNKILESIIKIPATAQIILCALQNQKLDAIKENANIINLDTNKLLFANKYDAIAENFERYKLHELIKEENEITEDETTEN
jgi:hypothetical protein